MSVQEFTSDTEKTDLSEKSAGNPLLTDLVFAYSKHKAAETALTFLDVNGEFESALTYGELEQKSCGYGAALQRYGDIGQVVLIAVDSVADFIPVFFGCLAAGLIAVPVPTPRGEKDKKGMSRIVNIAQVADAQFIVCDGYTLKNLSRSPQITARVLSVKQLDADANAAELRQVRLATHSTAYLQFTSGSTASPKGVVLTHFNVMASLRDMSDTFSHSRDLITCGWLPMHHDMGLAGLLCLTLYEQGQAILMPPAAFLGDPQRWFKAIDQYNANMCAAPNFAFEHCIKKIKHTNYDLSSMTSIYIGSEFVSVPTVEKFCEKFSVNGAKSSSFIPVYGLAEATLLAAGGAERFPEMKKSVVEYAPNIDASKRQLLGYAINSHFPLRVIEGNKVVVSGDAVASSYWPNDKTHCHMLEGKHYFETGDLGFIQNSRLYLTGREKDTLIVRGVNHHAEDLEFSISTRIGAQHGHTACFASGENDREHLIVVQEASRHISLQQATALKEKIRQALTIEHAISPDEVVIIAQQTLPRTLNHKVSRSSCLVQYENKMLKKVGMGKRSISSTAGVFAIQGSTPVDEPLALVSMACRLPGGCESPELFWELLANGRDAISEVPLSRWNNDKFYDPKPATPGKTNTRWAGFVDDIDMFDPAFFGISPAEAAEIDPQQRMLLEASWRLFENAGQTRETLKGSDTGVFIGVSTNDYLYTKIKLMPGMDSFSAYSGLGNANSIAANRISYLFDLKGPSMAIDTACSSSLTALHLAAQSIRNGDCRQAIAGGVNALISPGPTISLSQFGMMAPDGRCKTFDHRADGYVRAEGCALIMLKRKSDALQAGDSILGYILASAIAQDGHSNGITHPNPEAQQQLIRRTLAKGNINPETITYIEAHGTGTAAGDPVEVVPLRETYGNGKSECKIGSVKASIGHLEAGAGIASVLKILTMMQHRQIPPQLHLNELNPAIKLSGSRLSIAQELQDWKSTGPRRAAVSSFGFGGALAHMIIEQGPEPEVIEPIDDLAKSELFVLSATDTAALVCQAKIWLDWLSGGQFSVLNQSLASVCYTQAQHRSDFSTRYAVPVKSFAGLVRELERFTAFKPVLQQSNHFSVSDTQPGFLFTGQGQNYFQMGHALYQRFEVFKNAFDRCMAVYNALANGPELQELVFHCLEHAYIDASTYQCHLFAVQYSLAQLWLSLGVSPQVLIGHSVGEYAAAVVAGCMTAEDAMELLYHRGKLVETVAKGQMLSLKADHKTVESILPNIAIAARNSRKSTVISGSPEHIAYAIDIAKENGIDAKLLHAERAFHSPMMDEIADTFLAYAERVQYNEPTIPWVSTVTGEPQTQAPNAHYWRCHLLQTVLFESAAKAVGEVPVFIEIGPGGTTLAMLNECLEHSSVYLRSCNRPKAGRGETDSLLNSIGKLYQQGSALQWRSLYSEHECRRVFVPPQEFNRKRYWLKDASWDKLDAFSSDSEVCAPPASVYQIDWVSTAAEAGQVTEEINWIVIGEPSAMLDSLTNSLQGSVYPVAPQADRVGYHQQFSHIFNTLAKVGDKHWRVLYASALGGPSAPSVATLNLSQDAYGPADLIRAVQGMLDTGETIQLWILTQNVHSIGEGNDEKPNIMHSSVWGVARTLYLEQPQLRGGIVDIDGPCDALTQLLHQPPKERAVAIRNNQGFIAQLEPLPRTEKTSFSLRDDGVYLITGGLGGLGLKSCEWLVEKGVKHIVLTGRSAFPPRSQWASLNEQHRYFQSVQSLLSIEKKAAVHGGLRLQVESIDIRDSEAMTNLLASLEKPLRGIIHAAGVNWFSKIAELDTHRMLDTLKTNISAAWKLHELTVEEDLDCFIMYSSVSALWGSVELAHYTAANYFLDTLAHYRKASGLPALSIDWGPWDEVGMSAKDSEKNVLGKLGLKLMPPSVALDSMEFLLSSRATQAMVGEVDWNKFKAFIDFSLSPSLFAKVEQQEGSVESSIEHINSVADITSLPQQQALTLIDEIIRNQLSSVMLIDSIDTLDENHRFNFLGMDSLMAISFAAQLQQYLGIKMPNTLAYNYPTIKDVRQFIYHELTGSSPVQEVESKPLNSWLLPIDESSKGINLYCFPHAGSGASIYAGWKGLIPGASITAIQYPGRENHNAPPISNMVDMADEIVAQIDTDQPFAFVGHSLGALIAYEVASKLKQPPEFVVLSGCDSPHNHQTGETHLLENEAFVDAIIQRYDHHCIQQQQKEAMVSNLKALRSDITLLETYQPCLPTLSCAIHVLGSLKDPVTTLRGLQSWIHLSESGFSLSFHKGGHYLIKENPTPLINVIRVEMGKGQ